MGELFGTDGIRGRANRHPMTAELALLVGKAVGSLFGSREKGIVVGRDTRISGEMLENALCAGICSAGVNVYKCGEIPTPAVAFLCPTMSAGAGVVISASHNPFYDNGIKVFDGSGFKLAVEDEQRIEQWVLCPDRRPAPEVSDLTGRIRHLENAGDLYSAFLSSRLAVKSGLGAMTLVLDCANGATSGIAPRLFADIGAEVHCLCHRPNGININDECGSEHPENLCRAVVAHGARAGFAFDGDGDRLIAVDEAGALLTGDQVLAICARYLKQAGKLKNNIVVSTVMSNLGLSAALEKMGIRHETCDVGDRFVMQKMRQCGAVLGGEDSGHTIFLDHHTTGDGILTALKVLEAMQAADQPLSEMARVMNRFPQVLINVDVARKPDLISLDTAQAAIEAVESELGTSGRVLVRYSGTQPQCRVMVEGPTKEETRRHCQRIAGAIEAEIGIKKDSL
jgi:phosphoglucosamine mutase